MKHFITIISLSALICFMLTEVRAENIAISDSVKGAIKSETSTEKKYIPLDEELKEQNKRIIRTWISGSVNVDKASKRQSKRFKRATYKQEIKQDKIRLIDERMKLDKTRERRKELYIPQLNQENIPAMELDESVHVLFREGPDYFLFKKFKEKKSATPLKHGELKKLVLDFLKENKMLNETKEDKVKEIYVRERRLSEETEEGKAPNDFVLIQSVVLERQYDGKPVLNSKIEIGVLPDTKEIVLLKIFNWTPVVKESAKSIRIKKQDIESESLEADIEKRLRNKIKKVNGSFTKAEVKQTIPAWFQTNDGLIPVLAFGINIEYPSPKGSLSREYLEVINLGGSDEIFFQSHGVQLPFETP